MSVFDFSTIPSGTSLATDIPGGPSGPFSDASLLAFVGNLCDAIKALGAAPGAGATPALVSRAHFKSTAAAGLASGSPHAQLWTVSGGENVGSDITLATGVITIATAGIYAVSMDIKASAGGGKLIDSIDTTLTFNSLVQEDEVAADAASAALAVTQIQTPHVLYYMPAATTIVASTTVVTHDASVWSVPATSDAFIQRLG